MGLYNVFDGKHKNKNWTNTIRSYYIDGDSGIDCRYVNYSYVNKIYLEEKAWMLNNPFDNIRGCAIAQRIVDLFVQSRVFPSLVKSQRIYVGNNRHLLASGLYTRAERAYILG